MTKERIEELKFIAGLYGSFTQQQEYYEMLDEIERLQEENKELKHELLEVRENHSDYYQKGFASGYDSALEDIERQISRWREEKNNGQQHGNGAFDLDYLQLLRISILGDKMTKELYEYRAGIESSLGALRSQLLISMKYCHDKYRYENLKEEYDLIDDFLSNITTLWRKEVEL